METDIAEERKSTARKRKDPYDLDKNELKRVLNRCGGEEPLGSIEKAMWVRAGTLGPFLKKLAKKGKWKGRPR